MWAFDDAVTAPLHGFAGTVDYWTRASSKPWLAGIGIPTLVLNATNDPFVPAASLAVAARSRAGGDARVSGAGRTRRVPGLARARSHRLDAAAAAAVLHRRRLNASPARDRRRRTRRARQASAVPRTRSRPARRGPSGRMMLPAHRAARRTTAPGPSRTTLPDAMNLPPEIFKAYDIRGIVGRTLTPAIVEAIGRALGSLARERGRDTIVIGRDGRLSGPELAGALSAGIRAAGANVIDVGMVATPMTYFAATHLGTECSVDGHRQPQSARLQRAQDGDRRRHAVRRRHPGAAGAHRARRPRAGRRLVPRRGHRRRLRRPHRRRHHAGATDGDRDRRRQRRGRGVRAGALPPARLQGDADVLRRRRHLSEPPPGPFAAEEPGRPDRPRPRRRPRARPRLRRRRRPARRRDQGRPRHLSGPPADAVRGRRARARSRARRSSSTSSPPAISGRG